MQSNHLPRGLLIACTTCLILFGFSKLQTFIPFAGQYFEPFDLISEVKKSDNSKVSFALFEAEDEEEDCEPVLVSTVGNAPARDSMTESMLRDIFPPETERNYKGRANLIGFYQALNKIKKKRGKVRIAYFGDSMIEGDLVTQTLRKSMQEKFGGQGVGFVPITSISPGFRKTIRQTFSPAWKPHNFLKTAQSEFPFGISGEYFLAKKSKKDPKHWVEFKGTDLYPETQHFRYINLFYGQPSDADEHAVASTAPHNYVKVSTLRQTEETKEDSVDLTPYQVVNRTRLSSAPSSKAVLNFHVQNDLPIYGFSFEDRDGVYVDNFASRGHTGLRLKEIPGPTLEQFNQYFEYDLVILHFGLNVIYPGGKTYKKYKKGMKEVVAHFQKHMPHTDILLVSVTDKSDKIDGEMQTEPAVPHLVRAQKSIAMETGVGFFNLYRAMGGKNSMPRWAEGDPPLATKDYTHVNRRGARRLSGLINNYLMDGFSIYEQKGTAPIAESSKP